MSNLLLESGTPDNLLLEDGDDLLLDESAPSGATTKRLVGGNLINESITAGRLIR